MLRHKSGRLRRPEEAAEATSNMQEEEPRLKLVKKRPKRKRGLKLFLWLCVLILVAGGTAWGIANRDLFSGVRIEEWWDQTFGNYGTGEGFPVTAAGSEVADLETIGGDVALLSDSSLQLYNSTAKEIYSRQHKFQTPVLRKSDTRALVYDRGSTGYRIENRKRTVAAGKADYNLIAGDISKNGDVVLVTEGSGGYVSELTALGDDLKTVKFKWSSASNMVVDVAAAPDGNSAAAVTVFAENGGLGSSLTLLDFGSDTPTYLNFDDTLFFAVRYCGGRIIGIGDDRIVSVNPDGSDMQEFSYGDAYLAAWDFNEDGHIAVSLSPYEDRRECSVSLLDAALTETGTVSGAGEVRGISCEGGMTAVLVPGNVNTYSADGSAIASAQTSASASKVALKGQTAYVLEGRTVSSYSLS